MPFLKSGRAFVLGALITSLGLAGCSLSSAAPEPTPTGTPVSTSTPLPTATPPPSATPVPPTPTPRPAGLEFKPAQVPQGGFTIVYLNEAASSATATFQGRQYPMLHDGDRWWALLGVGALTQLGLLPVSVAYTPIGRTAPTAVVASVTVTDREFPVEYIELTPSTAALLAPDIVQAEIAQRAAIFAGYTAQRLWSGPFVAPARGSISAIYGEGRSYNGGPVTDYHRGTDFIGDIGAPVFASGAGRVVFTGALRVRGNAIIIDHGAGVFTAYHHLSSIGVAEGQAVAAGAPIGAIGSTGLVTGPHLHWEVILRGVEVDGELWLKGEVGP
jgi:hypothetical protein